MEYYIVKPDLKGYFPVGAPDEFDLLQVMDHLRGVVPYTSWTPIQLEVLSEDPYGEAREVSSSLADLMDLNATGIHVLSERAAIALGPLMDSICDLLPVAVCGQRYYLNHVIAVLDALDAAASEIERFGSGNIKSVSRYVLKRDIAAQAEMFRLTGIRSQVVVASRRIVDVVKDAGLSGFTFSSVEVR